MAYNVRQSKSLDHDPASGHQLEGNKLRELGAWVVGLGAMYLVYWLVRRYLF